MNPARKVSRLRVAAMTVAIASLALGAVPASAATAAGGTTSPGAASAQTRELDPRLPHPSTRYENLGLRNHCLDGDGRAVYLHICNGGPYQRWYYTHGERDFALINYVRRNDGYWTCLTAGDRAGALAKLEPCRPSLAQRWQAWGRNGWVVLETLTGGLCLYPGGTRLGMNDCPPRDTVESFFSWRYHDYLPPGSP
jgi:hypothetical protein